MTIGAIQNTEIVRISTPPIGIGASLSRIYAARPGPRIDEYDYAGVRQRTWQPMVATNSPQVRDMAVYGDRLYLLYWDALSPTQFWLDEYNLLGQRLQNIVGESSYHAEAVAVSLSGIWLYDGDTTIKAYSASGAPQSSGDITITPSLPAAFMAASESRVFILDQPTGRNAEVSVYTHSGQLMTGEGIRVRLSASGAAYGCDLTSSRFIIAADTSEACQALGGAGIAIIPYTYTPTSDSDFPDESMTRRDFVPGDDVIFQITSTPAPAQPVEVMYVISSGGNVINPDQNGAKVISIEAEETTITIPTRSSGVEDGYFVAIRLTQGSGYQLGPPDQISDRVGEEAT